MGKVIVEFTGPPRVRAKMKLMLLAVQIVERSAVMVIAGTRLGRVISEKRRKTFAPSSAAASYCSLGMACIAARNIIVKKGVPCQMATVITDQRARLGSARNWMRV